MSAKKCNYIIFHNGPTKPKDFELILFGSKIPYEKNPVFLGVIFDVRLTFNSYFDKIRTKCQDRIKIVRILSSKFYKLNSCLLLQFYSSMVRSVIDCTAFSVSIVPSSLAMIKTPGLVGDHSASDKCFGNDLVKSRAPLLTPWRQILNMVPPQIRTTSLKKGDRFVATIGPSHAVV